MLVAIQRDVMAEADKMAIGRKVVMEIIRFMIGHCNRLRHRSLCSVSNHIMADSNHGRRQMRTDEGISTDYNALVTIHNSEFIMHNYELKAES